MGHVSGACRNIKVMFGVSGRQWLLNKNGELTFVDSPFFIISFMTMLIYAGCLRGDAQSAQYIR